MLFPVLNMLRKVMDSLIDVSSFFTKFRPNIRPKENVVKINLGCGFRALPGWYNVDAGITCLLAKFPKFSLRYIYWFYKRLNFPWSKEHFINVLSNSTFVQQDLKYGVPFVSNSADYVYSSHMLEHFRKHKAEKIIEEAHRVLKKGGILRICVPDLAYIIKLYDTGKKEKALSYFFETEDLRDYGEFDRHKYMYDFDMLQKLLKSKGFKRVVRCSYRKGSVPDIAKLDVAPEETLYVEAQK